MIVSNQPVLIIPAPFYNYHEEIIFTAHDIVVAGTIEGRSYNLEAMVWIYTVGYHIEGIYKEKDTQYWAISKAI